jgi:hypothetical protein
MNVTIKILCHTANQTEYKIMIVEKTLWREPSEGKFHLREAGTRRGMYSSNKSEKAAYQYVG